MPTDDQVRSLIQASFVRGKVVGDSDIPRDPSPDQKRAFTSAIIESMNALLPSKEMKITDVFGLVTKYIPMENIAYHSITPEQEQIARTMLRVQYGKNSQYNLYKHILIGVARGDTEYARDVTDGDRVILGLY